MTAIGGMANLWYSLDTGTVFRPYAGGGLGMAKVTVKTDEIKLTEARQKQKKGAYTLN